MIKLERKTTEAIFPMPALMIAPSKEEESTVGIVGKVVNVTADESVMDKDNVDINLLQAIAFNPYIHGYYKVTVMLSKTDCS